MSDDEKVPHEDKFLTSEMTSGIKPTSAKVWMRDGTIELHHKVETVTFVDGWVVINYGTGAVAVSYPADLIARIIQGKETRFETQ